MVMCSGWVRGPGWVTCPRRVTGSGILTVRATKRVNRAGVIITVVSGYEVRTVKVIIVKTTNGAIQWPILHSGLYFVTITERHSISPGAELGLDEFADLALIVHDINDKILATSIGLSAVIVQEH